MIDKLYPDPLFSLTTLSEQIGVSPRQISRLLRTHAGRTFPEHLRSVRIEAAKSLLSISCAKIRDISEEIGYAYPSLFAKHFRATTGLTPSEFRTSMPTADLS